MGAREDSVMTSGIVVFITTSADLLEYRFCEAQNFSFNRGG